MNDKTKKAIEGSIEKWQKILDKEDSDDGRINCPLCKMFYNNGNCSDCPIKQKTNKAGCADTPYDKWIEHQEDAHDYENGQCECSCPECYDLAKNELNFLKSLLEHQIALKALQDIRSQYDQCNTLITNCPHLIDVGPSSAAMHTMGRIAKEALEALKRNSGGKT